MSALDKLIVQGIRSFGPDEEHRGMIKFYPLTLILGKNGAGKTTLIESLRYMASGDHPPGTQSGKTWIHDPQRTRMSVVKGQVKLKFRDVKGVDTTATRSMELIDKTVKGVHKPQFKTLDSIIKRAGKTLPTRAAEIDKEMLELLGASKAVMTNVIFCHQEDNCWPLSEGKALKEKFDQIFGSIGYVKALAKIKKVREDKMKEMKALKAEEELHYEYKTQAQEKQRKIQDLKDKLQFQKNKQEDIYKKQKPIETELQQIMDELRNMQDSVAEVASLKGILTEKQKSLNQAKGKIKTPFKGTKDELRHEIERFNSAVVDKNDELEKLLAQSEADEKRLKTFTRESNDLSVKLGKLQNQGQEHQRNKGKLKELIVSAKSQSLITGDMSTLEKQDAALVLEKFLRDSENELKNKTNEVKAKLEAVEAKRQGLNVMTEKMSKLEAEKNKLMQQRDKECDEARSNIESLRNYSRQANELATKMGEFVNKGIAADLERTTKRINEIDDERTELAHKKEGREIQISKLRKEISTEEIRYRDLQESMDLLEKQEELEQLKNRLKAKEVAAGGGDYMAFDRKRIDLTKKSENFIQQAGNVNGQIQGLQENIRELEKELHHSLDRLNEQKDEHEKELAKLKKKLSNKSESLIEKAGNVSSEVQNLQESIKELERDLLKIIDELRNVQESVAEVASLKGILKEKEKSLYQAKGKIKTPFKGTKDELRHEIERFNSTAFDNNDELEKLLTQVEADDKLLKIFMKEFNELSVKLGQLQNQEQEHQRDKSKLKQLLVSAKNQRLIDGDMSSFEKQDAALVLEKFLCEAENKLKSKTNEFKSKLEVLEEKRQDLADVTEKMSKLEAEKDQLIQQRDKECDEARSHIDSLRNYSRQANELTAKINEFINKGTEADLERTTKRINEIDNDRAELVQRKDDREIQISKLREDISTEEIRYRDLQESKDIFDKQEELEELKGRLKAKEAVTGGGDYAALDRKRIELTKKNENFIQQAGHVKGEIQGLQENIRELEKELQRKEYKNARNTYKTAVVNSVSLELMCEDLNKYYKALDKAVTIYHVRKMKEINKLIDHFWKQTYQGHDITTIRIACDAEQERSAADKKRNYNYRVAMVKDGIEMDMRGRCSAGQKVLASLVIRIALSQIFCMRCAVLALDEPTTNLDTANIKSLARAISTIVEDQKGKMQLIIITHDTEFLNCLSEENEFYYEVSKTEDGYSQIKQLSIRDRD